MPMQNIQNPDPYLVSFTFLTIYHISIPGYTIFFKYNVFILGMIVKCAPSIFPPPPFTFSTNIGFTFSCIICVFKAFLVVKRRVKFLFLLEKMYYSSRGIKKLFERLNKNN